MKKRLFFFAFVIGLLLFSASIATNEVSADFDDVDFQEVELG